MRELTIHEVNDRYEKTGEEFPCNDGRCQTAEDYEWTEEPNSCQDLKQ